jgi:hypothetical protein
MECIALIDKRMSKEHLDQLYEEHLGMLLTAQCMLETLREKIGDRNDRQQEPQDCVTYEKRQSRRWRRWKTSLAKRRKMLVQSMHCAKHLQS